MSPFHLQCDFQLTPRHGLCNNSKRGRRPDSVCQSTSAIDRRRDNADRSPKCGCDTATAVEMDIGCLTMGMMMCHWTWKRCALTRIQFDDYAVILAWVCQVANLRGNSSVDAGAVLCSGAKPRSHHRSAMVVFLHPAFANLDSQQPTAAWERISKLCPPLTFSMSSKNYMPFRLPSCWL